jgi:hypothetical protein
VVESEQEKTIIEKSEKKGDYFGGDFELKRNANNRSASRLHKLDFKHYHRKKTYGKVSINIDLNFSNNDFAMKLDENSPIKEKNENFMDDRNDIATITNNTICNSLHVIV